MQAFPPKHQLVQRTFRTENRAVAVSFVKSAPKLVQIPQRFGSRVLAALLMFFTDFLTFADNFVDGLLCRLICGDRLSLCFWHLSH